MTEAELERELKETRRVRDAWCAEYVRVRNALRPFAANVDAVSLTEALGHITREDLWAARVLVDAGGRS